MAQRFTNQRMQDRDKVKWIVISGPESAGKTELAKNLATRLGTLWVPEYARTYIENLNRPYTYDDIEKIALYQLNQEKEFNLKMSSGLLIFDTWFIITKVWFDIVFGSCPEWIINHIQSTRIDLFLVCSTDLPWIPDQVRENGGETREKLLQIYCEEIRAFGYKYEIVTGDGQARIMNALNSLGSHGLIK